MLLGSPWLSRAVGEYVSSAASAGARVVVVDPSWQWADPNRVATDFVHGDTDAWLASAIAGAAPCDSDWLDSWRAREDTAQAAIEQALGHELNEPQVARAVYAHAARHDETVVAAASMPIRDLEWFAATETAPPRVLANRGVNGIDGVVSTALGVATSEAQVASGHRTIGLLGDLAFLHDVSGLVNLPDAVPCTLVVLDNGGGGIFSFLPQAGALQPDVFERLFGTPPSSDIGAVARGLRPPGAGGEVARPAGAGAGRVGARAGAGDGAGARRERRPARRDQPGGPSRADVEAGEGVDVDSRPVGLRKTSSMLASPVTFHPISCTHR